MATHKSAEKRARQTVKRNEINRKRRSRVATAIKEAESAIVAKDATAAVKAQRSAESALAKSAGRTMHWKTAARKASRLAKRVKALKKSA